MMTLAEIDKSRILVVGLGKTGLSVCRFLNLRSVSFEVVDDRQSPPGLDELVELPGNQVVHRAFDEDLFSRFDVLVVSPGVPLSTPVIKNAIAAGAHAIGDIELFALSVEAPVIAVTGSNGKSSVVSWIDTILNHANLKSVLCGNIGEPVLDCLDASADVYVVELSSFQLETTFSLRALSAAVLNVSEDHLDRYLDLEHYAATKRRIYSQARFCIVNASDDLAAPNDAEKLSCAFTESALIFGYEEKDAQFTTIEIDGHLWLTTPDGKVLMAEELPLPGRHNIMNALAVLALLYPLVTDKVVTLLQIRQGLVAFHGLPHRTELVAERNGVRWFNDSKGTNVEAARRAIEAMDVPVVLIAGGLGKDADFTNLRDAFKAHVKALILMGRDASLIADVATGVLEPNYVKSMKEAVELASSLAEQGDAVLLSPACSSFDMFRNFEHRGESFTDEVRRLAA